MKKTKVLLVAALSLSLAAGLFGLTACVGAGGVAATINGEPIMEKDVTESIESMRAQNPEYSDPAAWAEAMAGSGLTPESLRERVIKGMAQEILLKKEAAEQGFTVDEDAIRESIENTKATTGVEDDAAWLEMLQAYGYKDEQAYFDSLHFNELQNQLYDSFEIVPSDEDLRTFISQAPDAVDGFQLPGTEDAEEPVAISPDDIDLGSIPEDVLDQYKDLWLNNSRGMAFQEWVEELLENADLVINPMPENVSYNVDMDSADGTPEDEFYPEEDEFDDTSDYSSSEAVADALAQGLEINDEVVGTGAIAESGSLISVHYEGTLEDGTVFDSNMEGDEPFQLTLGRGQVIRGWDAGIAGMQEGGTRTLVIPAPLAYGDADLGTIPPNSTLYFTVELVAVN